MRRATLAIVTVLLLALGACGKQSGPQEPQPRTTVIVDNQASLDMNIFVLQSGGARQRLGTATAHTRTTFTIPPRLIFGLTPLRFQADPIGASRAPISQEITVQAGDAVTLRIPPG